MAANEDDSFCNSLAEGDSVPDCELVDLQGRSIRLAQLLERGPLLITFYRGAWCPSCQADLRDLADAMTQVEGFGASILGVFFDLTSEAGIALQTECSTRFAFANDVQGRVAQAFGIRSQSAMTQLDDELGSMHSILKETAPWILPMQARYLITPAGRIGYSEVVSDYLKRSNLAKALAILETRSWIERPIF